VIIGAGPGSGTRAGCRRSAPLPGGVPAGRLVLPGVGLRGALGVRRAPYHRATGPEL